MHIKSIEIDGFKSYAQKQIVGKFDEQFNAITGLNGSGKSNILDSICFVLGITNLAHIRAQNNNDLIFKQGNAGITKAFVKITFDNTGARRFTTYGDEVTITRTISIASASSKGANNYTICGSNASSSAIADLFRSVGLNVNNPHFLIMQGRITKVLNMKPTEILGMIEEAAGTKMYDQKRNQAVSNMEKKDQKIKDIAQLMENEILPTVQRMKDDREEYLKYQKYVRDIEGFKKTLAAFTYDQAGKQMILCDRKVEAKEEEKKSMKANVEELNREIESMIERQKEQEKEKGNELKKEKEKMDKDMAAARNAFSEVEKKWDDVKSAMEAAAAKRTRAETALADDTKAHDKLKLELEAKKKLMGGTESRGTEIEAEIKTAKAKLLAIEQGMTTNDAGEIVSLESQITEAKTRLTEQSTDVKARDVRIKVLEKQKADKEKELNKHNKEDKEYKEMNEKNDAELANIKAQLDNMKFNEAEYTQWKTELDSLTIDIRSAENTKKAVEDEMRHKEAQFRDVPGVKRATDVLGMTPRFFKLKSEENKHVIEHLVGNHNTTTVVRSADVATLLMKNKAFGTRTTCVPMDGIDENTTPQAINTYNRKLTAARSLAPRGERVDWAVDLVDYEPQHSFIVNHTLANILVCDTKDTANLICHHNDVKVRVVTRDAEMDVRPSGVTGGGARATYQYGMDLARMKLWHEAKTLLEEKIPTQNDLQKKIQQAEAQASKFNRMKERQNALMEQIEMFKEKHKFSAVATIRNDLGTINGELPGLYEENKRVQEEMKVLKEKIGEFEKRKQNEKAFAKKEKDDWTKKLTALQAEQKKEKGAFDKAKTVLSSMRSELETLEQSLKDSQEAIVQVHKEIAELNIQSDEFAKASAEVEAEQKAAEARRDAFIEEMKKHDDNMDQLRKMIEKNKKAIQKEELKIEQLTAEQKKLVSGRGEWLTVQKDELRHNPWINDAKEYFGHKGTTYDFDGYDKTAETKKIQSMEAEMKKMNSNINMNTMEMLASSEERVMALQKKREQIERDRTKLMETIEKLDEKKKAELLTAYTSVNKDFNGIFSMLLPGTSAKLEPADGKDPLRGIEIKVAFNGKWKDSLGELSGGQRSLVALSLVLAMLKFRPAPLYILDEVDAALDLSHTQNIGAMIKTHFKESQFIIVSLKEGMFNHANVLFRTRFVDGTSQVSRTDNTGTHK